MKIERFEVRNFRSFRELQVFPEDILVLVGRNNSGKSNLLKAIELFFEGSKTLVNEECFHNHDLEKTIEIKAVFRDLTNWERNKFSGYLDGDKLKVARRIYRAGDGSFEVSTVAYNSCPVVEWLHPDKITGEAISKWWGQKNELSLQGVDFAGYIGSKKPTVAAWKEAAATFVKEHADIVPVAEEPRENPKGYAGVLKGALPEFIFVPAVRSIAEETKVLKTSPFGRLINSVLGKISEHHVRLISDRMAEIQQLLNRGQEDTRIAEIRTIEDRLNSLIHELMDCDIEIEVALPRLDEIFSGTRIFANDGIRTAIEMKGHGLQRSMIFTILRAYAELAHRDKAGESFSERSTIFAIEEPELYLHPQCQRTLMSVFRIIASTNDQIFYATHSSLFVDVAHFDDICIVRRERQDQTLETSATQLKMDRMLRDLFARKHVHGKDKGIRELYANVFDQSINEGFFADKIVLVEGLCEFYSLPIYASALGYDLDRANVSVLHTDGKGSMDRLLRIFTAFGIPTYTVFDGDKNGDKGSTEKTQELLELLGQPCPDISILETVVGEFFTVIDTNMDDILRREVPDFDELKAEITKLIGPHGKALDHKLVAANLREMALHTGKSMTETMPPTIQSIISRIQLLNACFSVLAE